MNDEIIKKLIQKSTITTSEEFTDKLLLKIEREKVAQSVTDVQQLQWYRFAIWGIIGVGVICSLFILFGFIPKLNMLNLQLTIGKTPLLVLTTLLFLLAANHVLKIQQRVNLQSK